MSNNVFIKFRSYLPGAGHNRSGSPKQGKTNVRGRLEVTYSRGGDDLTPADLGLDVIDDLRLTLEEPLQSSNPTEGRRGIDYSNAARQFYVYRTANATGIQIEEADASVFEVTFDAFGDSAAAPELT